MGGGFVSFVLAVGEKEHVMSRKLAGNQLHEPRLYEPGSTLPEASVRVPQIAIVRQKYRRDGGAEQVVEDMVSVLEQQAHDVTLIARKWSGTTGRSIIICNPPTLGRVWREWGFARAVSRELRSRPFDLVQCHERIAGCDIYRAGDGVHREWLKQRKRVDSPLRNLLTQLSPFHVYMKHAEKKVFQSERLRAVICNSYMVKQDVLDHSDIDARKLRVIYNGVDTKKFHVGLRQHRRAVRRELGIPDEATVFLFVGSGFERKGVMRAIRAIAAVPDAHLIVVGRDKRFGRFQRHTVRLGLARRVHFLGVREDVGPCYGAADAMVLPTLYEPFGLVVLEAMAAGLPVITSTKCGAAELIVGEVSGFVCDALDEKALARAMRCLTEKQRCRQMGLEARRTAESHTLDVMCRNLTRLYSELLTEKRHAERAA